MKEGILAVSCASLLPGLGFDALRLGLETFVDFTQTANPKDALTGVLEGASRASPYPGSLESQTQNEMIGGL